MTELRAPLLGRARQAEKYLDDYVPSHGDELAAGRFSLSPLL